MHEAHSSRMQIITLKGTTRGTCLNLRDFPEITYQLCHALDTFHQSRFFYMCYFKNPVQKNVPLTDEMTRVISTSTGISGVSLAYHIFKTSTVTHPFYCNFERDIGKERLRKVKKKLLACSVTFFL